MGEDKLGGIGSQKIQDRLSRIVSGEDRKDVLVAIWDTAPFLNTLAGVEGEAYFYDAGTKLKTQVWFQRQFREFILFPGIWADYGAVCEPSAFGCEIAWKGGSPTVVSPALKSINEIYNFGRRDLLNAGLLPQALDEYEFFWRHLDKKYIDEYGYLDGTAASFGPVELAAVLLGHETFFRNLRRNPGAIHALLRITTDFVTAWLKMQEKVNGPLKRIAIADHIPGQISFEHFEEFFLPYTNFVLGNWSNAVRLYHNEFPIKQIACIAKIDAEIFHFGVDIVEAKKHLGAKLTLMGNVPPIEVLWQGKPDDVLREAGHCLEKGAPGGRFLLSSGGGLAPNTPMENVRALETAVTLFRERDCARF